MNSPQAQQLIRLYQARLIWWNIFFVVFLVISTCLFCWGYYISAGWLLTLLGVALSVGWYAACAYLFRLIKKAGKQIKSHNRRIMANYAHNEQNVLQDPATIPVSLIKTRKGLRVIGRYFPIAFVVLWVLLLFFGTGRPPQLIHRSIGAHFEKIRNDEAKLTAFFSAMPKGGDLHHHLSGSVYAESFLQRAIEHKLLCDTNSFALFPADSFKPSRKRLDLWMQGDKAKDIRQQLFKLWSVKGYIESDGPSDRHFFDAFGRFPSTVNEYQESLLEIKKRAMTENVQYVETMLSSWDFKASLNNQGKTDSLLQQLAISEDTARLWLTLSVLRKQYNDLGLKDAAVSFIKKLENIHQSLQIDNDDFMLRYIAAANRKVNPATFFKNLLIAFESAADSNNLIAGVNILSQEDGEVAMRDYRLHIYMFRWCHAMFPHVKFSMHAGELALGFVKPEDLAYHIHDAVNIAGANRIGHGVDIAYEKNLGELLKRMASDSIPVEINLTSNEFILGISHAEHPVQLYHDNGVPLVISTDDAGILRSNLVRQFVLLAQRYPAFKYPEIRQMVLNSIDYSFIKNRSEKEAARRKLEQKLTDFENRITGLQ